MKNNNGKKRNNRYEEKKMKVWNIYLEREELIYARGVIVLSSSFDVPFEIDTVELSKVKFLISTGTFSPIKQRFYSHCY